MVKMKTKMKASPEVRVYSHRLLLWILSGLVLMQHLVLSGTQPMSGGWWTQLLWMLPCLRMLLIWAEHVLPLRIVFVW